jgi:hypothetical protein
LLLFWSKKESHGAPKTVSFSPVSISCQFKKVFGGSEENLQKAAPATFPEKTVGGVAGL